jgi:hypothetical protein
LFLQRCLQLVVTGEIPDVRIAPATRDAVHPTVVQLPIAIAFARIRRNINENMEKIQALVLQSGTVQLRQVQMLLSQKRMLQ